MARPKYSIENVPATEKLEAAFWGLLAEKPYASMTVREVSARAGVNKNAFYYHYDNLDEMAQSAMRRAMPVELIAAVLGRLAGAPGATTALQPTAALGKRIDKLCLAASDNGAPYLRNMLKETIRGAWRDQLGIDYGSLDIERKFALEEALGAMLAILAFRVQEAGRAEFGDILQSSFGAVVHHEVIPPLMKFVALG